MAAKERDIFINRELSWLEFDRRCLDLSAKQGVPLGEQLNFAAIYGSNLDEFFMIRVGSLFDQTLLKNEVKENKTGMTARQQLAAIMPLVADLQESCDKNVAKLYKKLEALGVRKVDFETLPKERENFWKKFFMRELYPVLSPQVIDRRHPFPFLRDRELYVGALLKEKKAANPVFGLIPVSNQYERLIRVQREDEMHFALVEELILHFSRLVFGESTVEEVCLFRITRNADINVQEGMFDHDLDYREIMSELLKKRRKLAAVRLQFYGSAPEAMLAYLQEKLLIPPEQCSVQQAPLELSYLNNLRNYLEKLNDPAYFYRPAKPIQPPTNFHLYSAVAGGNFLMVYPYHSFRPFLQMLGDAACDPDVVSIKMTLYRVASESKVIEQLIAAAENGKEVVTIVELRARFDEQNNIDWSRQLEQAGCTVIYGFTDYKVHSKLTLITRRRGNKFEYISQVGTGNYNEKTSELYTDLSYVTSDPQVGEEIAAVFNNLALERLTDNVQKLIVAPLRFKSVLLGEIQREIEAQKAGGGGRVILKCNSISDKQIIETLSDASKAGVDTDLIVRGICCLRAGVEGLTDNITVRSLVGRYLEHSRIYAFGSGGRLRVYIASGDFLTRNTERRVEVGIKIEDPAIQKTLYDMLEMQLRDNVNARTMQPDGSYAWVRRGEGEPRFDCQMEMYPYLEQHQPQVAGPIEPARPAETPPETQGQPAARPKRNWLQRLRYLFTNKE